MISDVFVIKKLVSTWTLLPIVNGDLGVFNSHKLTYVNLPYTPRDQKASFQAQSGGRCKNVGLNLVHLHTEPSGEVLGE